MNVDPEEPHTVTSGKTDTLSNDMGLVNASFPPGSDGALASTVNVASDFGNATNSTGVNSGFLQASPEDAAGRAQAAPGVTRIRITFNTPGTFYYHCALHDVDGMQGKVVVEGAEKEW
jgi:plastocyanin